MPVYQTEKESNADKRKYRGMNYHEHRIAQPKGFKRGKDVKARKQAAKGINASFRKGLIIKAGKKGSAGWVAKQYAKRSRPAWKKEIEDTMFMCHKKRKQPEPIEMQYMARGAGGNKLRPPSKRKKLKKVGKWIEADMNEIRGNYADSKSYRKRIKQGGKRYGYSASDVNFSALTDNYKKHKELKKLAASHSGYIDSEFSTSRSCHCFDSEGHAMDFAAAAEKKTKCEPHYWRGYGEEKNKHKVEIPLTVRPAYSYKAEV